MTELWTQNRPVVAGGQAGGEEDGYDYKGWPEGGLCSDGTVLYLDCGGACADIHV